MKKIIAVICMLSLATAALAGQPCPCGKKHPTRRSPAVRWAKCKPDTVVVEKSSKTPLLIGAAALVAGSIIAMSNQDRDHRVYVTCQPCPPGKKGCK